MNPIPLQAGSTNVWGLKYQLSTIENGKKQFIDKDIDDNYKRVARALANQEKDPEHWYPKFLWALRSGAIPAGRIMANGGAGPARATVSTINCTVSNTLKDSMSSLDTQSILRLVAEAGDTLKAGCGIGYDFTPLRPKGAAVNGAGSYSSGPLSFMNIFDAMCKTVSSAGSRRGAQMATFAIHHPDILEYIRAKRSDGVLRQFNLSTLITTEFMEAVENDTEWMLYFPAHKTEIKDGNHELIWRPWPVLEGYEVNDKGEVCCRVYKKIQASYIWDVIMRSTYEYADPGFILIDHMNDLNNNWFDEDIRATNPCVTGETEILTKQGYQPIANLVGKTVSVWNGFEWSKVKPKVTGENQEIIEFEFSDGSELDCTPYHTFVLKGGKKVKAKDLRLGDKLAKHTFPVIEGKKKVGKKIAYTQGFYAGDGQTGTNRIWLYDEKIALLDRLSYSAFSDQSASSGNRRLMVTMAKEAKGKSFVPNARYTVEARLSWLAGLIDSDGSSSVDGVVGIWSVDYDFLTQVKSLLNTLGVTGTISFGKPAGKTWMPDGKGGMAQYDSQESNRITISATSIAKLRKLGLRTYRVLTTYEPQRDASRFITVTSKEERDGLEAKVYCFTEKKNHTGIFNGIMTGQCGEQPLPPNGSCLLGSVNLAMFVVNPFTDKAYFDWKKYEEVVKIFTRMMDNVVELHGLPLQAQIDEIMRKRRHGIGYLGLGTAVTMMKMTYGDQASVEFTGEVSKQLAVIGYRVGLELAKEKGPAPIMSETFKINATMLRKRPKLTTDGYKLGDEITGRELLFCYSEYMNRIATVDPELVADLCEQGCRFTHHTSVAPTGTIAIAFANNSSNGIEPSFAQEYDRNLIIPGKKTKEKTRMYSYELLLYRSLVDPKASALMENEDDTELPPYFVGADQIDPKKHVDVQAAAQYWIDSSISKTINVPTNIPYDEFKDIYMYGFKHGLKGLTTFRFNPEVHQGVLTKDADLKNVTYRFVSQDGTVSKVRGDKKIRYDGELHSANNLYDAIKDGSYAKF